jgi:hypothetical protein
MIILHLEKNTAPGYSMISGPRFLSQAATDPEFPNKWSDTPLPRIPTNLEENVLSE